MHMVGCLTLLACCVARSSVLLRNIYYFSQFADLWHVCCWVKAKYKAHVIEECAGVGAGF